MTSIYSKLLALLALSLSFPAFSSLKHGSRTVRLNGRTFAIDVSLVQSGVLKRTGLKKLFEDLAKRRLITTENHEEILEDLMSPSEKERIARRELIQEYLGKSFMTMNFLAHFYLLQSNSFSNEFTPVLIFTFFGSVILYAYVLSRDSVQSFFETSHYFHASFNQRGQAIFSVFPEEGFLDYENE